MLCTVASLSKSQYRCAAPTVDANRERMVITVERCSATVNHANELKQSPWASSERSSSLQVLQVLACIGSTLGFPARLNKNIK